MRGLPSAGVHRFVSRAAHVLLGLHAAAYATINLVFVTIWAAHRRGHVLACLDPRADDRAARLARRRVVRAHASAWPARLPRRRGAQSGLRVSRAGR